MITLGQFYLTDGSPTDEEIATLKKDADRFFLFSYGKCGIDEARGLRTLFDGVAQHETVIFFIAVASLTEEAQNALLKIAEELPQNISAIFVVPSVSVILPTLLSRSQILSFENTESKQDIEKFLKMTYSERLTFVGKLSDTKKYDDSATMRKEVKNFVAQVRTKMTDRMTPDIAKLFHTVMTSLSHDSSRVKSILEYFALGIPYGSM
jgi:replication-associated recombination protein RarA